MTALPFPSPAGRWEVLLSLLLFNGRETVSGSTQRGKKGCCSIYLWMEGGRGTGQCLLLTRQPTCSWFCSNSLQALSPATTKLSLWSNSFVPPLEQNYLVKVCWGTENHRTRDSKPSIHLGLFSGGMCWEQPGGGMLWSMPVCAHSSTSAAE